MAIVEYEKRYIENSPAYGEYLSLTKCVNINAGFDIFVESYICHSCPHYGGPGPRDNTIICKYGEE